MHNLLAVLKSFDPSEHPRYSPRTVIGGINVGGRFKESGESDIAATKEIFSSDSKIAERSKIVPQTEESKVLYEELSRLVLTNKESAIKVEVSNATLQSQLESEQSKLKRILKETEDAFESDRATYKMYSSGKISYKEYEEKTKDYKKSLKKRKNAEKRVTELETLKRRMSYYNLAEVVFDALSLEAHAVLSYGTDVDKKRMLVAEAVIDKFQKTLSPTLKQKPLMVTKGKKAQTRADFNQVYGVGQVHFTSDASARTLVHELGHWIEWSNPEVHDGALALLSNRTKGQKEISLRRLSGAGYRSDEKTKPDSFTTPYIGKLYPDATEIVSMGAEQLFFDTERLLQDPDLFHFTVNTLRGKYLTTNLQNEIGGWESIEEKRTDLVDVTDVAVPASVDSEPTNYTAKMDENTMWVRTYSDFSNDINILRSAKKKELDLQKEFSSLRKNMTTQKDYDRSAELRDEIDYEYVHANQYYNNIRDIINKYVPLSGRYAPIPTSNVHPTKKRAVTFSKDEKEFIGGAAFAMGKFLNKLSVPVLPVVRGDGYKSGVLGLGGSWDVIDTMKGFVAHAVNTVPQLKDNLREYNPKEDPETFYTKGFEDMIFDRINLWKNNRPRAEFLFNSLVRGWIYKNGRWYERQ